MISGTPTFLNPIIDLDSGVELRMKKPSEGLGIRDSDFDVGALPARVIHEDS